MRFLGWLRKAVNRAFARRLNFKYDIERPDPQRSAAQRGPQRSVILKDLTLSVKDLTLSVRRDPQRARYPNVPHEFNSRLSVLANWL